MTIPKSHPRYLSLKTRDMIVKGVTDGITSIHGLIAHGRGEAFDYLMGEKTQPFAKKAISAAASLLLSARRPVISVNGNACALVPQELVTLSKLTGAPLEVNIFHASKKRELAIQKKLIQLGAPPVLLPSRKAQLPFLDHNRKWVNAKGIARADVVFVPLEDGDRCLALRKSGKKVVTVDLNPLSRTARSAHVTIVDNIIRCLPLLNDEIERLKRQKLKSKKKSKTKFQLGAPNSRFASAAEKQSIEKLALPNRYDNKQILKEAEGCLRR